MKQGDAQQAQTIFRRILTEQPTVPDAQKAIRGLAQTLTVSHDPGILQALQQVAHIPGPLQAHAQQAVVHGQQILGHKEAALQAATTLYQENPDTKYGYFGRLAAMYLHWELGRPEQAAQLLAETAPPTEREVVDLTILQDILRREGVQVPDLPLSVQRDSRTSDETLNVWDAQTVVVPNPYSPSRAQADASQQLRFSHVPPATRIHLYAVNGREIFTASKPSTDASVTLQLPEVPAGVYLYVVEELDGTAGSPTGKRATGKFVVIQ